MIGFVATALLVGLLLAMRKTGEDFGLLIASGRAIPLFVLQCAIPAGAALAMTAYANAIGRLQNEALVENLALVSGRQCAMWTVFAALSVVQAALVAVWSWLVSIPS